MKKNIVRLTEGQLHQVIKETVKRVVFEARKGKKDNQWQGLYGCDFEDLFIGGKKGLEQACEILGKEMDKKKKAKKN